MSNRWGTGWSRHRTFGLRTEWLRLYIDDPTGWRETQRLGNRQIDSLDAWLRTVEVVDRQKHETYLGKFVRRSGLEEMKAWKRMWCNCVFSFPTAGWYVQEFGAGHLADHKHQPSVEQIGVLLSSRTCRDAVCELVGLLERTPIGKELGQGEVTAGRPRVVYRPGLAHPGGPALAHALWRLFQQQKTDCLDLGRDLLWPWTIYGCSQDDALWSLLAVADRWLDLDDERLIMTTQLEVWDDVDLR